METIKRLYKNRNDKREINLDNELKIWKFIHQSGSDDILIAGINSDEEEIIFELNNQKLQIYNLNKKEVIRILQTFAKKIFRINSYHYKIKEMSEMNINFIKDHAKELLSLPRHIQLFLCTEPNKQSVDEIEQRNILNEELNLINYFATKPKGNWYIKENNFELRRTKNKDLKSIDCIIAPNNLNIEDLNTIDKNKKVFFGYCKVIMVAGGHQDNQIKDAINFVKKCNIYCQNENNSFIFFIQADGKYAIKNIELIKNNIINNDRIFAGTTIELINWIKNKFNE